MMLTEDQKMARRHSIGSSDMAAVLLGRNSFGTTRHDVWAEKTGKLDDWEGNAATHGGNRYESLILDMAEESLGPLERDTTVRHTSLPLAANLDGRALVDEPRPDYAADMEEDQRRLAKVDREPPDAYDEEAQLENYLRRHVIAVTCNHIGEVAVACDCGKIDHPDPHRRCLACGECFELETEE